MAITISGFRRNDLKVTIEGGADLTVSQLLQEAGIPERGKTIVINGNRAAAGATVRDGDTVEVLDKPNAGR